MSPWMFNVTYAHSKLYTPWNYVCYSNLHIWRTLFPKKKRGAEGSELNAEQ